MDDRSDRGRLPGDDNAAVDVGPHPAASPAGWLTASDERHLIRAVQHESHRDRERAVRKLLSAFEPMFRAAVHRWSGRGVADDDLRQVASIGFLRAVERFDLGRPSRLSSYARLWIEGAIRREVMSKAPEIGIPREATALVMRIEPTRWRLAQQLGREPTLGELAFELKMQPPEIEALMQLPRKTWSLDRIRDGETGAIVERDQRRFDSRASAMADDTDEDFELAEYRVEDVDRLLRHYQEMRSALEVQPPPLQERRLRRRHAESTLCRLIDLDYALQRVDGAKWVVLELAGMRGQSLRALERLLGLRHSTLQYRMKIAERELVGLMNDRTESRPIRRLLFWRRLFAWSLGAHAWLEGDEQPEPVAFEVWARVARAGYLSVGERVIPIRALAAFGEGWLITPELLARKDRDDESDV